MRWNGFAAAVDVSPACFDRPYAEIGSVRSDST